MLVLVCVVFVCRCRLATSSCVLPSRNRFLSWDIVLCTYNHKLYIVPVCHTCNQHYVPTTHASTYTHNDMLFTCCYSCWLTRLCSVGTRRFTRGYATCVTYWWRWLPLVCDVSQYPSKCWSCLPWYVRHTTLLCCTIYWILFIIRARNRYTDSDTHIYDTVIHAHIHAHMHSVARTQYTHCTYIACLTSSQLHRAVPRGHMTLNISMNLNCLWFDVLE